MRGHPAPRARPSRTSSRNAHTATKVSDLQVFDENGVYFLILQQIFDIYSILLYVFILEILSFNHSLIDRVTQQTFMGCLECPEKTELQKNAPVLREVNK